MTAQWEHSQCPLVEMDTIISQRILLLREMSLVCLTLKSMETFSAQLGVRYRIHLGDPGPATCSAVTYATEGTK